MGSRKRQAVRSPLPSHWTFPSARLRLSSLEHVCCTARVPILSLHTGLHLPPPAASLLLLLLLEGQERVTPSSGAAKARQLRLEEPTARSSSLHLHRLLRATEARDLRPQQERVGRAAVLRLALRLALRVGQRTAERRAHIGEGARRAALPLLLLLRRCRKVERRWLDAPSRRRASGRRRP